jgi:hypothetical protein
VVKDDNKVGDMLTVMMDWGFLVNQAGVSKYFIMRINFPFESGSFILDYEHNSQCAAFECTVDGVVGLHFFFKKDALEVINYDCSYIE